MKVDPDMNLDLASYVMAGLLINAARSANLDNERASGTGTLPVIQWKLTAARWSYALSVWRENVKSCRRGGSRVWSAKSPGWDLAALSAGEGRGGRSDRWGRPGPDQLGTEQSAEGVGGDEASDPVQGRPEHDPAIPGGRGPGGSEVNDHPEGDPKTPTRRGRTRRSGAASQEVSRGWAELEDQTDGVP